MTPKYSVKLNITHKDLFDSSMNATRRAKTFIFDLLFTFAAIFATVYMFLTGKFFQLNTFRKILMFIACIIFPVIQPLIVYIKTSFSAKKFENLDITLDFYDDKLSASTTKESTDILYNTIYDFIKYKNMIVIMYDSIHGQIIPKRFISDNYDEMYNFVSTKIKESINNNG